MKIPSKYSGGGTQQLCSTNFCVHQRETERIILNELFKNKNEFSFNEECNPLPRGCKRTLKKTSKQTIPFVL